MKLPTFPTAYQYFLIPLIYFRTTYALLPIASLFIPFASYLLPNYLCTTSYCFLVYSLCLLFTSELPMHYFLLLPCLFPLPLICFLTTYALLPIASLFIPFASYLLPNYLCTTSYCFLVYSLCLLFAS